MLNWCLAFEIIVIALVAYVGMKSTRKAVGGYILPMETKRKLYTSNVTVRFIQSCFTASVEVLNDFGCHTIMDATPPPARTQPDGYKKVSEAAGINIILSTGVCREMRVGGYWSRKRRMQSGRLPETVRNQSSQPQQATVAIDNQQAGGTLIVSGFNWGWNVVDPKQDRIGPELEKKLGFKVQLDVIKTGSSDEADKKLELWAASGASDILPGSIEMKKGSDYETRWKDMVTKAVMSKSPEEIKSIVAKWQDTERKLGYDEIVNERSEAIKKLPEIKNAK